MAVPLCFRGFLLHLELHEIEVVDVLDGQGAVRQLCAHGEVGGHVSPCDYPCAHSQSETRGTDCELAALASRTEKGKFTQGGHTQGNECM